MGGKQAREIGLGEFSPGVHLPMPFSQLTGKLRRVSLPNGFQKSRHVGLLLRGELGQLRLDFLHAHTPKAS